MAFQGFSADALHFLFENRIHDSKAWFEEHRPQYRALVQQPLNELVAALSPAVLEIDPRISTSRCVSRIYRDTRFSKDKTMFRDKMWLVFTRGRRTGDNLPGFYFEMNQEGYLYGCGYYMADRETMEEYRAMILAGDKRFRTALRAYEKQNLFTLEGERYKRSKYPDRPERLRSWLDRKTIEFSRWSHDFDTLFSPALVDELAEGFRVLKPIYDFMCSADEKRLRRGAIASGTQHTPEA